MSKKGCIYILTNPSFPNYIKIGYATDIEKRLKQLNRSETLPFAFRVYSIYEVDKELTDKEVHKIIDSLDPSLRTIETFDGKERVKEFYAMKPEAAYQLFECIAKISGTEDRLKKMTPEGHEILDEEIAQEIQNEARRGPFRFSLCDIPIGSEITFIGDKSVKATVVNDRQVEYNGVTTSLSALAQQLKGFDHATQGPRWFEYNGKLLSELREEMEG